MISSNTKTVYLHSKTAMKGLIDGHTSKYAIVLKLLLNIELPYWLMSQQETTSWTAGNIGMSAW